jgi:hypothetical protein
MHGATLKIVFRLFTVDATFYCTPHTAKSSTVHGSEFGRRKSQTVA